jgi:hypothetical protein
MCCFYSSFKDISYLGAGLMSFTSYCIHPKQWTHCPAHGIAHRYLNCRRKAPHLFFSCLLYSAVGQLFILFYFFFFYVEAGSKVCSLDFGILYLSFAHLAMSTGIFSSEHVFFYLLVSLNVAELAWNYVSYANFPLLGNSAEDVECTYRVHRCEGA